MSNLNFDEVGQVIRVNAGKDITSSTPTLILNPEFGYIKERTSGVTVGSVAIVVDGENWNADEYIEYTTVAGDLDYTGRWQKKAELTFSTSNIEQTDYVKFRVLP